MSDILWVFNLENGPVREFPGLITKITAKNPVQVTERPVEGGVLLQDHVILQAKTLSVTVCCGPHFRGNTNRHEAEALLKRIQETRTLSTIGNESTFGPYPGWLLSEYTPVFEVSSGVGSFEVECTFTRLRFVNASVSNPIPRHPRNRPVVNRGPQGPRESERRGLLLRGYEALGFEVPVARVPR